MRYSPLYTKWWYGERQVRPENIAMDVTSSQSIPKAVGQKDGNARNKVVPGFISSWIPRCTLSRNEQSRIVEQAYGKRYKL